MDYRIRSDGEDRIVSIIGEFKFTDQPVFRDLIEDLETCEAIRYVVDISELTYIDSAALGMLVVLHDIADQRQIGLCLRRPQGEVKRMLDMSRFHDIVPIET